MGRAKFYLLPAVGLLVLAGLPTALATASTNNDAITNLFNVILIPAILIGGLVYVLIFAAVILFRRKPGRRRRFVGKFTTEHRALEVAWTLIPAFVLIFVGVLSIQVLSYIEFAPPGSRDINVIGQRFSWSFNDPLTNNTTQNVLTVYVGQPVHVHVHSVDVIHSFYIPDMGIKIDAFPDRITHTWFNPTVPGTYIIHCAEFCGLHHDTMKAKLVVLPRPASGAPPPPPRAALQPTVASTGAHAGHPLHLLQISQAPLVIPVQLKDSGCPPPGPYSTQGPFCIVPAQVNVKSGTEVTFRVTNAGAAVHNFTVGAPFDRAIQGVLNPAQTMDLVVNITQSESAFFWCAVDAHRDSGMQGGLIVDDKTLSLPSTVPELPLGEWLILGAIGVAVASAAIYHVRAVRRGR